MSQKLLTREEHAKTHFEQVTACHEMHVLHDEGLYRHLRFRHPDTWSYGYDLVTWPGHLAINGDLVSGYTFARIPDMLDFFDVESINPQYWEEKITCRQIDVREWDEEWDEESWDRGWEWSYSYLLSCHAILRGVKQYKADRK